MEPLDVKEAVDYVSANSSRKKKLTRLIAVLTSIFAFLAAFNGLMSARCTTRGMVAKNDAIYFQGLVSDTWAYFQSRNIRSEITDVLERVSSKKLEKDDRQRFKRESDELYDKAKKYENERDMWNSKSSSYLDVSKTFATAMTFLQVAVVLVPLNLILESAFLLFSGSILGSIGFVYMLLAYKDYFNLI